MGYSNGLRQRRVGLVDELRGFDILLMVAYHAAYDLVFIFGIEVPFYRGPIMHYVQPVIAGIFIVLSGISCRYSRSNAKRGLKTLALGMLLTAVTLYFIPEQAIYFGILHFMGTSMLIFSLLEKKLDTFPAFWGLLFYTAMFVVTYRLPEGYIGINGLFTLELPDWLYTKTFLLPLGFAGAGADYFPLIPYIFLYFAGSYLGEFFVKNSMPNWFYRSHAPWLSNIGRHSIIIYMLHQPIIYGIIWAAIWLSKNLGGIVKLPY